jgi:hypothetical protein
MSEEATMHYSPRWLAAAIICLSLVVYTFTIAGRFYSLDGLAMYQQAKILLFEHTLRFEPPLKWLDYEASYTYWPIGLSLTYLLPLAFFSLVVFPDDPTFHQVPTDFVGLATDSSFLYVGMTHRLVTALTAGLLVLLAVRLRCSRTTAVGMALVYSFGSPAFVYQKLDFAQPLASLLVTGTFYCAVESARRPFPEKAQFELVAGCSVGLLVLTRPESAIIVVPVFISLALWDLRRYPTWRKSFCLALMAGPMAIAVAAHCAVNWMKFGSPFGVVRIVDHPSLGLSSFVLALLGLLISPGRGVLVFFPIAVLAPLGAVRMARIPRLRPYALAGGALVLFHLLFFAAWPIWWGGGCWGPRFMVPVIPVLALLSMSRVSEDSPLAPGPPASRTETVLRGVLILLGFVTALAGIMLPWDHLEAAHMAAFPVPTSFTQAGRPFFYPDANPLWTSWRDLCNPGAYDLLLARSETASAVWQQLWLIGGCCAFSLMVTLSIKHWRRFRSGQ